MSNKNSDKIRNGITALLIASSIMICGHAIVNPSYDDNTNNHALYHLDKEKQFVTGILFFEAGALNHIYKIKK